uniref:NOT2/NOT3/NOT5 C-terminal domain-containing protein n=1 Tax=Kalanchoe fedtschenkoi TaxID=63787 RepID=A0A7N0UKY2_KALFE
MSDCDKRLEGIEVNLGLLTNGDRSGSSASDDIWLERPKIHVMSGFLNPSLNGSGSNLPDSSPRSFSASFSGQAGAPSPAYHHSGSMPGLHNVHGGSFNMGNMGGAMPSRNSTLSNIPSSGIQQPTGNVTSGRYVSSNIPIPLSQMSHGSSHGHSVVTSRGGIGIAGSPGYNSNTNSVGGSIPGILPTSASTANRSSIPGLGVSPMLGNVGHRIHSSMGNMAGGGNIGRSLSSAGGLSAPGIGSRMNLIGSGGVGSLSMQAQNRLMGGVLQQASPQVMSMLGNSYPGGGQLSQSQINSLSSMGMLGDVNNNESSPFDLNDFPQLSGRPTSAGGTQGQLGLRKHGMSPIVQQNQEFSIQNEDFPALPGFKGGNAEYSMDSHQKEQLHENAPSMMQSQHFNIGRSAGFNLGGTYLSHRPQQQQHVPSSGSNSLSFSQVNNNSDLLHLRSSEVFPTSHSNFHSQASGGPQGIGLQSLNSSSSVSGVGSYDQLVQQYQQQNQSQFRLQQMSAINSPYRDQNVKSTQLPHSTPDPYGLLGLLSVIRMSNPNLTSLALGTDLTTLGLNLNSAENLHKTFGGPWSEEPIRGDTDFSVPQCYSAKQPPTLHQGYFSRFSLDTLFYIFYSMPKDEAQLYAANELHNKGWFYHKEHRLWFTRVPNTEPLVKTNTYERGPYLCFDPTTFDSVRKDNFVVHYELVEKRPVLPQY